MIQIEIKIKEVINYIEEKDSIIKLKGLKIINDIIIIVDEGELDNEIDLNLTSNFNSIILFIENIIYNNQNYPERINKKLLKELKIDDINFKETLEYLGEEVDENLKEVRKLNKSDELTKII